LPKFGEILHQKRKWPRFPVIPQEELKVLFSIPELSVHLEQSEPVKKSATFNVNNISRGGIGISLGKGEDPSHYPPGKEVFLTILWGERRAFQKARIASFLEKERNLGVEFVDISPETDLFLGEVLSPKRLGASLKEVFLKPSGDRISLRWFHGDNATDLFIWQSVGDFVRHQFILGGDLVEWTAEEGVRTGEVLRDDFSMIRFSYPMMEPNLIQYHPKKSQGILQRAQAALGASSIDLAIKEALLQTLWKN